MKVNGVETRVETPIPPITKDQSLGCQSQLGVTTNSSGNEPGAGGLNNVDAKGMQGAPVLLFYSRLILCCSLSRVWILKLINEFTRIGHKK